MLMGRIRNAKSKYRGIAIVIVVLLAVSLVGTFAVWSSPTTNGSKNSNSGDAVQQQITALKSTIANEKSSSANDYTSNEQIAEDLYTLAGVYQQAGDTANMTATSKEAVQYFDSALKTAPSELNATGKANIYAKKAAAANLAGDAKTAKSVYEEALTIDPLNWDVNIGYASIIYNGDTASGGKPDYKGAIDYLKSYQEKLGTDSQYASQVASYISNIEQEQKAAASTTSGTSGTTGTNTTTSGATKDSSSN